MADMQLLMEELVERLRVAEPAVEPANGARRAALTDLAQPLENVTAQQFAASQMLAEQDQRPGEQLTEPLKDADERSVRDRQQAGRQVRLALTRKFLQPRAERGAAIARAATAGATSNASW
jgi:hypothetical protein